MYMWFLAPLSLFLFSCVSDSGFGFPPGLQLPSVLSGCVLCLGLRFFPLFFIFCLGLLLVLQSRLCCWSSWSSSLSRYHARAVEEIPLVASTYLYRTHKTLITYGQITSFVLGLLRPRMPAICVFLHGLLDHSLYPDISCAFDSGF
eukprot:GHVQ01036795.1.p1 GENE.GHVQ01036795.1~~GHVQ01036795.1.p1  ORF type:complete len:146 (-),score=0.24 GHVQ01036795.1:6-443(-)